MLYRALEMPCRMIAENAGEDGTVVVAQHRRKSKDKNYGYNADTDEYDRPAQGRRHRSGEGDAHAPCRTAPASPACC